MSSDAMIYIPSFIKLDLGIQKLEGGHVYMHSQQGNPINPLLYFQTKENRLIIR
jgi:hypothetical protein